MAHTYYQQEYPQESTIKYYEIPPILSFCYPVVTLLLTLLLILLILVCTTFALVH